MENYKGYSIEVFEERSGNWFSKIKKIDGSRIIIKFSGESVVQFKSPSARYSAADALAFAHEVIDGGGMD